MIEPWFSAETASRFAFLSLLSMYALVEIPARRGRHRALVLRAWNGVLVFSALLIILGATGWILGQPSHVVRALVGSGFLIGVLFLILEKEVLAAYGQSELRKTIAQDM